MKLKRNSKSRRSRRKSSRRSRKSRNIIHVRNHKRNRSNKRRRRSKRRSKRRSRSRKNKVIIKYKIPDGLSEPIYDFKLVEMEGCGYCKDSKKLILDNNYTLEIKKTLSLEEENKVKEYPYYPKIFKYNKISKKYDFIGGYDKLKELIKK